MSGGVERQFWESFEGWARRRISERINAARVLRHAGRGVGARYHLELAREMRLGLAAAVARGDAMGLPK